MTDIITPTNVAIVGGMAFAAQFAFMINQFHEIRQAIEATNVRLDGIEKKLAELDKTFSRQSKRITTLEDTEKRVNVVEKELHGLQKKTGRMEEEIGVLEDGINSGSKSSSRRHHKKREKLVDVPVRSTITSRVEEVPVKSLLSTTVVADDYGMF